MTFVAKLRQPSAHGLFRHVEACFHAPSHKRAEAILKKAWPGYQVRGLKAVQVEVAR